MRRLGFAVIGLCFLLGQGAAAAPSWGIIAFSTTPQNAATVLAAADKLMGSAVGQKFPGRLLLQASVANGNSPATHSFVPIYKSAKEREEFVQRMQRDPAWQEFLSTMTLATQPVSQTQYRTLKSWGPVSDDDRVWMAHAFNVSDPPAFVAAVDAFLASKTGKKHPGQVHLSSIVAGGLTRVTHVISVGYTSEAEMDAWLDVRDASADWTTYIEASRPNGEYLGSTLSRDLKAWGPASLEELTAR
jgi:hypothetical protein